VSRPVRLALLILAASLLLGQTAPVKKPPEVQTGQSQAAMTPAAAIDRLQQGNRRFVANAMKPRDWSAKVAATASGQYPFAAILGCMDSRAPIEIAFDQGLGDVFGVRVAGNVVNPDELGSLEYAVSVGAKLIVVLGHTGCGAVKGAIQGVQMGNLTGLLAKIQPAVEAAGCHDAKDEACVDKVAVENPARQSLSLRADRRGIGRSGRRSLRREHRRGELSGAEKRIDSLVAAEESSSWRPGRIAESGRTSAGTTWAPPPSWRARPSSRSSCMEPGWRSPA
jgi:carbonic anhydrase